MSLDTIDVFIKSKINLIIKEEKYTRAFLVYLASLISLLALPPYPYILVPFLALIPAYISYSNFKLGIMVAVLMAVMGFYYIGATLGNLGLLLLSLMIFFLWSNTNTVFLLFMMLFLPLLQPPFSALDGLVVLAYLLSAYTIGSRTAIILAIISVIIVFALITVLDTQSTFFLKSERLRYFTYEPYKYTDKLGIAEFFSKGIPRIFSNIFSIDQHFEFGNNIYLIIGNVFKGLFDDMLLTYIIVWSFILFFPTYLTGIFRIKNFPSEALTALPVLLLIPIYMFYIYPYQNYKPGLSLIIYPILTVIVIFIANMAGIRFSKEIEIKKYTAVKDMPFVLELSVSNLSGLDDVAGYDDVKNELKNAIINPLKNSELKYAYGIKPARGILLFGPPGTGKTLLMNALAKELDYPLLYVKTSEMLSRMYGESPEKNITKLFQYARKKAPVILFFDEIDMIAKKRDLAGVEEFVTRMLTALLQELDGVKDDKPIVFVASTNIPHLLDPALLRPGRIDKIIYMRPPNLEERKMILKYYLKKLPHEKIDYDKIAALLERYSGADIANLVQEVNRRVAAKAAEQGKLIKITTNDILEAMKNIKPSITISMLETYERFKLEFERRLEGQKDDISIPKLNYSDVVDMEDLKNEMRLYIEQAIKNPEVFEKYGIKPARGILLFGPPGTGKTYFLKATAGEFKLPFIFISGSDILKEGYERGAAKIKEIFNLARERAPALVVIDEIDTLTPTRTGSNPLVGQLLQELDGLGDRKGVFFMATTNLPNLLDPALLRPGRIDKIVYIGLPNLEVRRSLISKNLSKFLEPAIIEVIARRTEGYTHADIVNICDNIKRKMLEAELVGRKFNVAEIENVLESVKPSINPSLMQMYNKFKESFERG